MGEALTQIAFYINGLLFASMKYYAFVCIFRPAAKKYWMLLAYLAFVVVTSQVFFVTEGVWLNIGVNLVAAFLLTFLFAGNLGVKFIAAFLFYAMGVLAEVIAFLILNAIHYWENGTGVAVEAILVVGRTVANVIHLPLVLIVILIFRKVINQKARRQQFKVPIRFNVSILLMLSGIVLGNVLFVSSVMHEINEHVAQVTVAQLASSGVIFLIIWLYNTVLNNLEEFERNNLKDQMLKRWEMQYQTVTDSQAVIAKLKHNLKYHFFALAEFLEKDEAEKAKAHIRAEIGRFDAVIATGNMAIDSILNHYQHRVKSELGIDFETELMIPAGMELETQLIVVALGNALENAVEACARVEHAERYICFQARYIKEGELLISIKNPFSVAPVVDRNGDFITSKEDKRNHGIGLSSVREMLTEETGYLHTEFTEKEFCFLLHFYHVPLKICRSHPLNCSSR